MGRRIIQPLLAAAALALALPLAARSEEPAARFVGSEVCAPCHAAQHERFLRYSKKAHSSKNLRLMAKGLTDQELTSCYGCHTTGYGRPGGFTSFAATPQLADAGCEVCHGPGSLHAASGDPAAIKGRLTLADCDPCHNDSRVRSFGYKPLLNAGAH
ncbi:cytochrome c family protein [Desulfovibrio sp. TomC]|uniref:cytochrome c family protein n=1 Tax=Desulfovibrio sp. TomC TaxID=1562888 RepID=UPI00057379B5|nr:cytochrome c family protein [Desulfovibrio sp. TomC]KHK02964.1 Cytochrome C553 (soluble cytochrome f) [Desulfovibrio sp. TomC]